MYDWANSVYSLCISTAIFPLYYTSVTNASNNGSVQLLGREYANDALYSYTVSLSFLLVALMLPLVASVADYRRSKLAFMKFFCYLGAASCALLYFFTERNVVYGLGLFALATIGFAASLVFNNAYLKEIVDEDRQDRVSALGFSLGYLGSVLLLVANLAMIMFHDQLGIATSQKATQLTFVTVGIWWAGFAQIPFGALRRFERGQWLATTSSGGTTPRRDWWSGYQGLVHVWQELKALPALRRFLIAFFLYNAGVQTVMYLASIFGAEVIFLNDPNGTTKLIVTVLLIQLVASAGAFLFARLSQRWGNVLALSCSLVVWIAICLAAYFMETQGQFYSVAVLVGMIMGGVQALSRSTYAKLIPTREDTASFFSFYDATDKISIVVGTALYGLIAELTGDLRNTALGLVVFFFAGLTILWTIRNQPVLQPKSHRSSP